MADFIKPKEITVTDSEGSEHKYIISKFPAIAGREIVAKYPLANMPKLGDYAVSEETMIKLMGYVAVDIAEGNRMPLNMRRLIDQHVPDWETLGKIEVAMMDYNCSFFRDGRLLNTLQGCVQKVLASISKTLTDLSAQSSPTTRQNSGSSNKSTV